MSGPNLAQVPIQDTALPRVSAGLAASLALLSHVDPSAEVQGKNLRLSHSAALCCFTKTPAVAFSIQKLLQLLFAWKKLPFCNILLEIILVTL